MKKVLLSISLVVVTSMGLVAQNEIRIMDFDEFKPHLQQKDDKLHLINFWASWCRPCLHEMPYFIRLIEEHPEEAIDIILVSLDFGSQIENDLKPYVKKHELASYVIVLDDPDADRWIDAVSPEWSGSIPFTIAYKGDERKIKEAAFDSYEELRQFIDIKQ